MARRRGTEEYLIDSTILPSGHRRTISVRITDRLQRGRAVGRRAAIGEKYSGEGGWLGRHSYFLVEVDIGHVGPFVALIRVSPPSRRELRNGVAEPLVSALRTLTQRGELTLPPTAARDRIADLLTRAGVPFRRMSTSPHVELGGWLTLSVRLDETPRTIVLSWHAGGWDSVQLVVPYEELDRVTLAVEQRLAPTPITRVDGVAPGDRIGRLIAAFQSIVGAGHAQVTCDLVADWLTGAGIPVERRGERRQELLRTHRRDAGCEYWPTLGVSSIDDRIWFTENYEYYGRPGDSGGEYAYSAQTPYASLDRLVTFFERRLGRPGTGDADQRLFACFAELISRGDLAGTARIKENRDRVAAWFKEAGVPSKPESWVWSSD